MDHRLIKPIALFSACGGPLYIADTLKPFYGDLPAFAVGFAPIGLITFGSLWIDDDGDGFVKRLLVRAGLVGAYGLAGMNLYTAWKLLTAPPPADRGLIIIGLIVGTIATVMYVRAARRSEALSERPSSL